MIHKLIYNWLVARLQSEVPEIAHYDLWDNQPNREADEISWNRPAIFIHLLPINNWQSKGEYLQTAVLNFNIHLQTDALGADNSSRTDTNTRNNSLYRLELLGKVYKALHGYTTYQDENMIGYISRTGTELDEMSTQTYLDKMSFTCSVEDATAKVDYDLHEMTPVVEGTVVSKIT